ncbi:MAG: TetR/AcrR family transcriptional regulator [Lachnospiraceae bacterium]|jgi:AcrR family transcriptional regulator|nr:TetR/AcrR family transcriptional regulator [Lachnospiraceae bacterium]
MTQIPPITKQQQKSLATKRRIFHAAREIFQRDGYENLSIKNICAVAGVSTGSFYHHFSSKDDLLSYYIEEQPGIVTNSLAIPKTWGEAKDAIIEIYLNYVKYCRELGVAFVSNYYTPKNQSLNPVTRSKRPYPILSVRSFLEKALSDGALTLKYDLEQTLTDIRMIVIGNVFEWCLMNGATDFEGNMSRSLGIYLDGLFH